MNSRIKNYLLFLIYLILNPQLFKIILQKIYLPTYLQFSWLSKYQIDTFIDVGAYRGDVSASVAYLFPKVEIFAFEPIAKHIPQIKSKLKGYKHIVENIAVSNKSGFTIFYENAYNPGSSTLPLVQKKLDKYKIKHMNTVIEKKVPSQTLDEYFKNKKLAGTVFLKIDTQGAEGIILEAGKTTLKQVDIVHVETWFDELYETQYLFDKIYDLLIDSGFTFHGHDNESQYYPNFNLTHRINAIFIKPHLLTD